MVTAGNDRGGLSLLNLVLGLNVKEGVCIWWRLGLDVSRDNRDNDRVAYSCAWLGSMAGGRQR
jgi:hypothetical protein